MIIIHLLLLHLSINAHRPTDQLTYTGMDGLELIHLPACNQHLHHHHNNKGEHKHKISCAMPFPTSKTLAVAPSASSIARKRLSVSLSLSLGLCGGQRPQLQHPVVVHRSMSHCHATPTIATRESTNIKEVHWHRVDISSPVEFSESSTTNPPTTIMKVFQVRDSDKGLQLPPAEEHLSYGLFYNAQSLSLSSSSSFRSVSWPLWPLQPSLPTLAMPRATPILT